ncbi:MAG TPA: YfiR family protein [Candidatus Dormibacteraeota bacterium]|nr:YfiR family protein [Candidatus Dormibacteraeota bacterium]
MQRLPHARIGGRVCCAILTVVIAGATAFPVTARQEHTLVEYQVEAAFLYNFAKFIEWPGDTFQTEKSPIVICVFGHDSMVTILDEVVRGKTIGGREVAVRRENETSNLRGCQMVFVDEQENKRLPLILGSLAGSSVLVVGESEDFAERGGTVQFYLDDNKLRFAINVDAVQRAHLNVSSRLLALARIVHDNGHPKG